MLALLVSLLSFYSLLVIVRVVVEMVVSFAPSWRPSKYLAALFEVIFTVTDPPIKLARKIIPPLQLGYIRFDFSIIILMFFIFTLINILAGIG